MTLSARLLESDDPQLCSGWNIGPMPGSEIPVCEVVDVFLEEWGSGTWRDMSDPNAPHEAMILRLAIDKALWGLPWRPSWNTRGTLRRTAEWYRAYLAGERTMREVSLEQIECYERDAFGAGDTISSLEEKPTLLMAFR